MWNVSGVWEMWEVRGERCGRCGGDKVWEV